MTPDREPNRLPLRAGAMLLFAVAVVCIGLGWHSAATTSTDPESDLAAAAAANSSTAPRGSAASSGVAGPSGASTGPTSSATASGTANASGPLVCVFNAGSVSGLAQDVNDDLRAQGWRTAPPGNLQSASITENTVFYTATQRAAAQRLVGDLGDDASAEPRPAAFTRCRGGIAVIVVSQ